ncbi:ATP-binding protein [Thermodesulfobacteriota bacterium]
MRDLSLHILDVVENATAADADLVEIKITQDSEQDLLEVMIRDNGRGIDKKMLEKVSDPFTTTRTTRRVGLGLPLLEQAAREAGGSLTVNSDPGHGTEVRARFQASHIDRKPIGDMGATLISLIMGSPDIDFIYESDFDGERTTLDTREIRAELGGEIALNDPLVLNLIKELFADSRPAPGDFVNAKGGNENGEVAG